MTNKKTIGKPVEQGLLTSVFQTHLILQAGISASFYSRPSWCSVEKIGYRRGIYPYHQAYSNYTVATISIQTVALVWTNNFWWDRKLRVDSYSLCEKSFVASLPVWSLPQNQRNFRGLVLQEDIMLSHRCIEHLVQFLYNLFLNNLNFFRTFTKLCRKVKLT